MSNAEVVVVATFKLAKEEDVDTAIATFTEVVTNTHTEEGCLAYALHRDNNDPTTFALVETWRSQADLDAHFQMPYMAKVQELLPLLAEPPHLHFCTPLGVGDPQKGRI